VVRFWASRTAGALSVCFGLAAVAGALRWADLSPEVEGDFFFAEDDPQMRASREVARRFPSGSQLILRVEGRGLGPDAYRARVVALTEELAAIDGVDGQFSISTGDPARSPLFGRILLTPDPDATNVVLDVTEMDPELLLPRIERVVERHESPELGIAISGVPAIVELIRRSLERDLVVFSAAAVIVFTLLMAAVYRDAAIVIGTLATCATSVAITLLAIRAMSVGIGLLTANLVTIVFVLTLSHVVFLTASWRRAVAGVRGAGKGDRPMLLRRAIGDTVEGSFWSMVTTMLGFASLLVATARPLRELGVSGAAGALTAMIVAYVLYPTFLGGWAGTSARERVAVRLPPPGRGRWLPAVVALGVVGCAAGLPRLDTDPGLLTYFDPGSELYEGLARIDADGGSSTLDIVVEDPDGATVDSRGVFDRMQRLQSALEADSAVGVVLSPTVLVEHARSFPLAGFLPVRVLFDIASSEALGGAGRGFVAPERDQARFSLRMRESVDEPRADVLARLRSAVENAELEPVLIAGLYDLQAQLGRLVASSVRIGIGGLLALFLGIALVVSRSVRTALAMWLCLVAVPIVVLGAFGFGGIALDIITSPAANIALAIGADSMIHLVVRVRRLSPGTRRDVWAQAVRQIARPVLGATVIIGAGFGIFVLSSFPPTRRFGLAVILGSATAATVALLVLPRLACFGARRCDSLSGS